MIGGSNNVHKPGGAIVRNIISGDYQGELRIVNPKEDDVQGIKACHDVKDLPQTDLAVLVVAAKFCPDYVDYLCSEKGVRAFVIISAGFGEETHEGGLLEQRILDTCEQYGAALIGPNCIGLLNRNHHSVFTLPIPKLSPKGVDFISGSGATAVFILESAVSKGLQFNSVWSIGNGMVDRQWQADRHRGRAAGYGRALRSRKRFKSQTTLYREYLQSRQAAVPCQ